MPTLSKISQASFHNEAAAFEYLEATLWPDGPVCPHCGVVGNATKLQANGGVKDGKRQARIGLWKCKEKACRKQFTVKVGTVFEHGRIPLHKMLQAVYLLCCSKKGCSAHQLHRVLGITYKAAWFLAHRIREAMRPASMTPMGGAGGFVEADETYIGRLEGVPKQKHGGAHKNVVLTLVERGGGARSFHVDSTSVADIVPLVRKNIAKESHLMTDEARHYVGVGQEFAGHGSVEHTANEYVRDGYIHTNTVEGYYSIFKRGMKGIYQHCSEKHLHRYLAEFDFRYSNRVRLGVDDTARTRKALQGVTGKRLTYRYPNGTAAE
jgi:transposase-like protein